MIEKDKHGFYVASCDKCNVKADCYGGSCTLRQFVDGLHRLNWKIEEHKVVRNEWTHTCPACQETTVEVKHGGY